MLLADERKIVAPAARFGFGGVLVDSNVVRLRPGADATLMKRNASPLRSPRSVMVAVMLGAALSVADAKPARAESSDKAIADIQRYCAACWRNARLSPESWPDCTQEVFNRLMQRVPVASWEKVLTLESDERRECV